MSDSAADAMADLDKALGPLSLSAPAMNRSQQQGGGRTKRVKRSSGRGSVDASTGNAQDTEAMHHGPLHRAAVTTTV